MSINRPSLELHNYVSCIECCSNFATYRWEADFRQRMDVPLPVRCPECRSRRRLSHLNQIHLFRTASAVTGKPLITNFPPGTPFPITEQPYWHSDAFDATKFGRPYDPSRSFFDQFAELSNEVPRPNLSTVFSSDENSPYTNFASGNKDCYLLFNSNNCRDCYYCYGVNDSTDSLDCFYSQQLELSYECIGCIGCYSSAFLFNCESCSDSQFLSNCVSCTNCIQCSNLLHKTNHYRNEPVTAEFIAELKQSFGVSSALEAHRSEFLERQRKAPQKATAGYKNEDCLGNHLVNCKAAIYCFDCVELENAMFCSQGFAAANDCLDCDECGGGELLFDSANSGLTCYHLRWSSLCDANCKLLSYCILCTQGSSDCFGCIGLKRNQYCILNQPYSETEYRQLVTQITDDLKARGEWGEYFPPELSPFPFQLTQAAKHYPLSNDELHARGYRQFELPQDFSSSVVGDAPCESLAALQSNGIEGAFECRSCSKAYKILPRELAFYERLLLAPPSNCFLCRHAARESVRAPRRLASTTCDTCSAVIATAYGPPRWEKVYCEKCFAEALK